MAKRKKKEGKLCLLYGALICLLFVLSNYIVKFSFELNGTIIYYSVFTIPFIYLFTCLLYKKYGFKKVIIAICTAILLQLLAFLVEWLVYSKIDTGVLVGTMLSVPFAQLITVGLYKLIGKKYENILSIFIILAVAVLFDNLVFLNVLKAFGDKGVVIHMITISNLIKVVLAFISSIIVVKTN